MLYLMHIHVAQSISYLTLFVVSWCIQAHREIQFVILKCFNFSICNDITTARTLEDIDRQCEYYFLTLSCFTFEEYNVLPNKGNISYIIFALQNNFKSYI